MKDISKSLADITNKINDIEFSSVDNLEKAFTEKRFENMAKKYKEVDKLLQRYKKGKISYATFRDKIKQFRDTNREYQKAGS